MVGDQGVKLALTSTTPAMLGLLLRDAVRRLLQRRWAASLALDGFEGQRASIEIPQKLSTQRRSKLSAAERSTLRNCTLGKEQLKDQLRVQLAKRQRTQAA